jgi:tetratricopeptide (TPR) repeat protein
MSISRRGPGATNTDKVTGDLTRLSWEKLDSKITPAKPLAISASTQNGHIAIDLAMFAVQPKRQSFFAISSVARWCLFMVFLFGCEFFDAGGLVRSGRQALLKKDFEKALELFVQAAQKNPKYRFESMYFSEGIWTYVGRTQYATGRLSEARQSLERALDMDSEDHLARLFWGLTLLRDGHRARGIQELQSGLQSLHDWLDEIDKSRPFEPYWDPDRRLRSEILKTIAIAAEQRVDEAQRITSAEWVGAEFEEEIDRARWDERRQRE